MPDTRGDVLCPTCGQWTPPAPYCTECGAALQLGFQDAGDADAFRRGHEVSQPGAPWSSQGERFEPEPEDQAAAALAAGDAAPPRIDHLAESEPPPASTWPDEAGLGAPAPGEVPPPAEPPSDVPADVPPAPPKRRTRAKAAGTAAAAAAVAGAAASEPPLVESSSVDPPPVEPPTPAPRPAAPPPAPPPVAPPPSPPVAPPPVTYAGPPRDGGDDGNSGVSGLVFVVFLGIGVLALLGGAILGGVFDGPVAEASPTPSAALSTPTPEPTPTPSASPSPGASAAPSATPAVTPPPAVDGFVARAEPCVEQPSDSTCDSSGAVNDGEVWILVSFRHAQPTDLIAVSVLDSSGAVQDESSISLSFCGTNTDCAGYTYFLFGGFASGNYDVRATRNGEPAATTEFTVE